MIKQLIKKLFSENITKEKIECAIDETVVECEGEAFTNDALNYYAPYTGVPAPVLTPHDDWFEDAPKTEMQMEYEHINDDPHDGWWLRPEWQDQETKESANIHQEMYDLASRGRSLGGSEMGQGHS